MIKPLKRKAYLIKSLNQQWSQKCRSISIRRIVIRWIVVSRTKCYVDPVCTCTFILLLLKSSQNRFVHFLKYPSKQFYYVLIYLYHVNSWFTRSLQRFSTNYNFSRPFRFNSWISTKQYQKNVTETKVETIPNGTLKMAFFAPWFLGFTTIIIKY